VAAGVATSWVATEYHYALNNNERIRITSVGMPTAFYLVSVVTAKCAHAAGTKATRSRGPIRSAGPGKLARDCVMALDQSHFCPSQLPTLDINAISIARI
jgi:hypothetical protein